MGALKTAYLVAYNTASAAGWAYLLVLVAQHFQSGGSIDTLYAAIEQPLKAVQSAALLEVGSGVRPFNFAIEEYRH